MERSKRILIVGGGAASVAIVRSLVFEILPHKHSIVPFEIAIVEPRDEVGPGIAYGSKLESARLNMPIKMMSVDTKDRRHFSNWLSSKHPDRVRIEQYLPRSLFGEYLSEDFNDSKSLAAKLGISVQTHKAECLELKRSASIWHALLNNGEILHAHFVVIAVGNQLPATYPDLIRRYPESYINNPWDDAAILKRVSRDDEILVLGTGLTGIDVALTLLEHGHRGKVVMASRSGRLPKVRPLAYEQQSKVFYSLGYLWQLLRSPASQKICVEDIFTALKKDTEHSGLDAEALFASQDNMPSVTQLEYEIECAARPDHWHAVVNDSDRLICALWRRIRATERTRFLHSFYSRWAIYRHPMPSLNANRILRHLKSSALEVTSLPANSVSTSANAGFECDLAKCGKYVGHKFDKIIDATGPNLQIGPHSGGLLSNLIRSGFLKADICAGVVVDYESSRAVSRAGQVDPSLFVIGQLTRGTHFYTNSMESITQRAYQIASHLAAKLEVSNSELPGYEQSSAN